jgi:hypothetical protein
MAFKYLFFSMSLFHLFQARVFLSLSLMINAINVCVVCVSISNGNASEAKANEGFDNSIFFASEAKRTCSLEGNLLAKRSEHVRKK